MHSTPSTSGLPSRHASRRGCWWPTLCINRLWSSVTKKHNAWHTSSPLQFYISQKDDSKIEKASTDLKRFHVPITICNIIITLGAAKSSTSWTNNAHCSPCRKRKKWKSKLLPTDTLTVSSAVSEPWAISTNHAETSTSPPNTIRKPWTICWRICPTKIPANYTQALPNITVTPKRLRHRTGLLRKDLEERQNRTEHSPSHDREMPGTIPAGTYRWIQRLL